REGLHRTGKQDPIDATVLGSTRKSVRCAFRSLPQHRCLPSVREAPCRCSCQHLIRFRLWLCIEVAEQNDGNVNPKVLKAISDDFSRERSLLLDNLSRTEVHIEDIKQFVGLPIAEASPG